MAEASRKGENSGFVQQRNRSTGRGIDSDVSEPTTSARIKVSRLARSALLTILYEHHDDHRRPCPSLLSPRVLIGIRN